MTVADYIKQLLSFEEYAFSLSELYSTIDKSETSIKSELSRLIDKREILNLRKGFYLIIPPRYSKVGHLPVQLYIEKLFSSINRRYYLGLYSAAKFYGASHQQIQKDYVLHDKSSLLSISKDTIKLDFFTVSTWPQKNILSRKGDAGVFKISSPGLTAVDLLYHQTKIGGLNRMTSVIEELIEEIQPSDIKDLLSWYPHKSVLQRLGFLFDEISPDSESTDLIYEYLKHQKFYPVLLSPRAKQKAGAVDNKWKVDVNIKIESDL